tara:strand:- start:86 stop:850 length:765 start_codon:yes stop_codon:yes gene_type:complete
MIFNKSIVISLKSEKKRRQRVISQKINHQFFDAVDGRVMTDEEFKSNLSKDGYANHLQYGEEAGFPINKPGLASCLTWKSIVEKITEPTLIMEDDIVVCNNFYKKLNYTLRFVPKNWDIIYVSCLSYLEWGIGKKINEHVIYITGEGRSSLVFGTGALLINSKCKNRFLSMYPSDFMIDCEIYSKLIKTKKIKSFILTYYGKRLAINDNLGGSQVCAPERTNLDGDWGSFKNWSKWTKDRVFINDKPYLWRYKK